MFIYNIKLSGTKVFKFIFVIIIAFVIILCGVVGYKLYKASVTVNDDISCSGIPKLTNKNYSSILKNVHENVDTYVGQKIQFSGFVYRVYDLNKEQFVLGRNMIISSDFQTVVVGFLCHYKEAETLKDNVWVEIEGTITKGIYHGDMPIL